MEGYNWHFTDTPFNAKVIELRYHPNFREFQEARENYYCISATKKKENLRILNFVKNLKIVKI